MEKRGRDKFKRFRPILLGMSKLVCILPMKLRKYIFISLRMTKGIKGIALRYVFLKTIVKYCGDNVSIHPGVYLLNPENLSLGDNISIYPMCYIDAAGTIKIGDDVSIAHSTTIMSSEHIYTDLNIAIKDQGCTLKTTEIMSNVWIGAGSRILAGSTINEGAIVGAGSVVKNEVEENIIVGGIPAKKIKRRGV